MFDIGLKASEEEDKQGGWERERQGMRRLTSISFLQAYKGGFELQQRDSLPLCIWSG